MTSKREESIKKQSKKVPYCYDTYLGEYMAYHDYSDHGLQVIREFIALAKFLRMTPPSWDYLYDDMWMEVQPYNGELKQFIRYTANRYKYRHIPIKNHEPKWLYKILLKIYLRIHGNPRKDNQKEE